MSFYRLVVFVFCAYCIRLGKGRSTHVNDEKALEKGIRFFVDGDPNDRLTKDGGVSIYINNIVYKIKTLGGNKYININKVHGNRDEFNGILEGYHEFDQDEVNNDNTVGNESSSSENGVDGSKSNNSLGSERDLSKINENYTDTTSEGSGRSVSKEAVEVTLNNKLSNDEVDDRKVNEIIAVPNIKETEKHYSRNASKINTKHKVKSKSKNSSNDAKNDDTIPKPKNILKSKEKNKSNHEVNDEVSAKDGKGNTKRSHEEANYTRDGRDITNKRDKKVLQERDIKASSDSVKAMLLKSTTAKTIM